MNTFKILASKLAELPLKPFDKEVVKWQEWVGDYVKTLETPRDNIDDSGNEEADGPPCEGDDKFAANLPSESGENFVAKGSQLMTGLKSKGRPTEASKNLRSVKFNNTQMATSSQPTGLRAKLMSAPVSSIPEPPPSNTQNQKRKSTDLPDSPAKKVANNPVPRFKIITSEFAAYEDVEIYHSDIVRMETVNFMTYDRIMGGFSYICARACGEGFCGFAELGAIAICHPKGPEIAHVRSQTASGLTCVQVLFTSAHFILVVRHAASEKVFVYNSLDSELSPQFRYQLFMLFGTEMKPVHVSFPVVQKQLPNTNQCGPMVAAYMAEIVGGGRPDKTLFDKA
ncbi:hypothetical protein BV898_02042 [Hypsibius exemplaris]|uniref:Uncharacterized protein n=1 Tax=Hypsibius exemplaris TaxID=2072580 RepID=A0A1W0X9K8_HYPEX|nr:hypothetical protein BV898_02042 [Hypsibius exemplaris]